LKLPAFVPQQPMLELHATVLQLMVDVLATVPEQPLLEVLATVLEQPVH